MNHPSLQLALWALARVVAISTLLIPGWSPVVSDMNLFRTWMDVLAEGQMPASDMWQYPPGVGLVLWSVGKAQGGIPGLIALIVLGDLVVFWLLKGSPGALLWAAAPLLIGPLFLMRLDTVVTALAALGVVAGARRVRSGLLLGLGASMKLWPLLLTAAYSRKESLLRGAIGLGAYIGVALVATAVLGDSPFVANQNSRGLQVESAAGWPFMVAQALGAEVTLTFRNGASEIDDPLADLVARALVPVSVILVGLIGLRSWRAGNASDPASIAPRSVLIVATLLVTSRVLSPQFNIWLLGIVAVALTAPGRFPNRGVIATCATALATQVLYPHVYLDFLEGGWFGLSVQTVRLAALLVVLRIAWSCTAESESGGTAETPNRDSGPASLPRVNGDVG